MGERNWAFVENHSNLLTIKIQLKSENLLTLCIKTFHKDKKGTQVNDSLCKNLLIQHYYI